MAHLNRWPQSMYPKQELIEISTSQLEAQKGGALVTIDEFFDGNEDPNSIGCNLCDDHPGLAFFRQRLKEIEARADVTELWMEIYDWREGEWPFSENVLIRGSLDEETVKALAEPLMPSEIWVRDVRVPHSRVTTLIGKIYNLWWD